MDFIAEMVLGYADSELSEKIKDNIKDYNIIRYRDDYRIFVNNPQDGEKILKFLTEIMIDLGMKLNPSKTKITNQIIKDSIKNDKIFWLTQNKKEKNLQKKLLIIHHFAISFPNSGSLITALVDYYKHMLSIKNFNKSPLPLISIVTDIAYNNPKTHAISAAILSKLVNLIEEDEKKISVINRVKKRFDTIPNTGYLQIWLQRITFPFDTKCHYDEPICKIVAGDSCKIWNSDWLNGNLKELINSTKIINLKKLKKISHIVAIKEIELFISQTWDY